MTRTVGTTTDTTTMLGRLLREAREAVGLSQADLARRSGISQGRVSGFESGYERDIPRETTILALATAIGCDPTPLLVAAGRIPQDVQEQLIQAPAWFEYVRTHPSGPPTS